MRRLLALSGPGSDGPIYPASHGCLRVPIPDASSIYRWIKLGDRIDVYA